MAYTMTTRTDDDDDALGCVGDGLSHSVRLLDRQRGELVVPVAFRRSLVPGDA